MPINEGNSFDVDSDDSFLKRMKNAFHLIYHAISLVPKFQYFFFSEVQNIRQYNHTHQKIPGKNNAGYKSFFLNQNIVKAFLVFVDHSEGAKIWDKAGSWD